MAVASIGPKPDQHFPGKYGGDGYEAAAAEVQKLVAAGLEQQLHDALLANVKAGQAPTPPSLPTSSAAAPLAAVASAGATAPHRTPLAVVVRR
jgi:hypothetical protein